MGRAATRASQPSFTIATTKPSPPFNCLTSGPLDILTLFDGEINAHVVKSLARIVDSLILDAQSQSQYSQFSILNSSNDSSQLTPPRSALRRLCVHSTSYGCFLLTDCGVSRAWPGHTETSFHYTQYGEARTFFQRLLVVAKMPSPTRDPIPRLAPPPTSLTASIPTTQAPSLLHSPSSPGAGRGSPHRTLRKLASAHNLGYGSAANLRASIANPPSLIAQQRLHQQQHHHPHPRRSFSPARRHASTAGSALNKSPTRGRANSDAPILPQLTAAAAAMSSIALRNSGALGGRTAYDHIPLEKLIRDGPPDGDWDNAVECARMKVLQQEIKSDNDGMVSSHKIWPLPTPSLYQCNKPSGFGTRE